jgi:hypothetical protein
MNLPKIPKSPIWTLVIWALNSFFLGGEVLAKDKRLYEVRNLETNKGQKRSLQQRFGSLCKWHLGGLHPTLFVRFDEYIISFD